MRRCLCSGGWPGYQAPWSWFGFVWGSGGGGGGRQGLHLLVSRAGTSVVSAMNLSFVPLHAHLSAESCRPAAWLWRGAFTRPWLSVRPVPWCSAGFQPQWPPEVCRWCPEASESIPALCHLVEANRGSRHSCDLLLALSSQSFSRWLSPGFYLHVFDFFTGYLPSSVL